LFGASTTTLSANAFGSPTAATWYFIAFNYDAAADLMSMSVNDGTVNTAAQTGGAFSGTAIFTVGAIGNPANYFHGRIDQLGLTTAGNSLTTTDITYLYNASTGRTWAEILTAPDSTSQGSLAMKLIMADEV
jgi:hypothetical protein